MNIAVIFTGGTIASKNNDNYLSPDNETKQKLIHLYKATQATFLQTNNIMFHEITPYQILSENLEAKHINCLVSCVKRVLFSSTTKYDGIVITHGTDTLQYTAAALGLCFSATQIPILLVSSNFILEDSRANGLINFTAAIEYICTRRKAGVFVSYANTESARLYPATQLLAHSAYADALFCVEDAVSPASIFPDYQTIDYSSIQLKNQAPILYLKPMPGFLYPVISNNTNAILLESYHSGTLCTAGDSLKSFAACAYEKGIPIYLIGMENRAAYESTKEYEKMHIHVLPKAAPIAVYMLLWYIYSIR